MTDKIWLQIFQGYPLLLVETYLKIKIKKQEVSLGGRRSLW